MRKCENGWSLKWVEALSRRTSGAVQPRQQAHRRREGPRVRVLGLLCEAGRMRGWLWKRQWVE